jgi:hypothetical protein
MHGLQTHLGSTAGIMRRTVRFGGDSYIPRIYVASPTEERGLSNSEFLRKQAEKCRFLAESASDPNVAGTLREIATEYEAEAARIERAPPEIPEIKAT